MRIEMIKHEIVQALFQLDVFLYTDINYKPRDGHD